VDRVGWWRLARRSAIIFDEVFKALRGLFPASRSGASWSLELEAGSGVPGEVDGDLATPELLVAV